MTILLLFAITLISSAFCAEQRIVGGSPVPISDHPYVLSMRVTGSHSCVATLISNTRAVTAAHCSGSAIGVYSLLGGTSDRTVTNCPTCVLFDITNINIHPNYDENGNGFPNDVAVLSFSPQTFNANFQPIDMAQGSEDFAGETCTIVGWGLQQQGGNLPLLLQEAEMTVMTNTACAAEWGALSINDGHLCLTDTNSASCNGDSGAPVVCSNLFAGMISWGHVTCSPQFPSVCTRISYFYGWIIIQ